MGGAQRPPAIPGTVAPRARDAVRLALWNLRGWAYGATRGPVRGRLVSVVLVLTGTPLLPLLVALTAAHNARPAVRAYMDPERCAVLGVTATPTGWRIDNHAAARPGTGTGAALRALVLPTLTSAATAQGVTIHLDAAAPTLASAYARELPELVDVGPAALRGRSLQWTPKGAAESAR